MVNHNYGLKGKNNRDEINKQRKDMGVDKFEGLLPEWQPKTSYYNHIPKFNTEGKTPVAIGSDLPFLKVATALTADQKKALSEDLF